MNILINLDSDATFRKQKKKQASSRKFESF
jgi:hypothetical protein